jgi:hypothetical protein
MGWAGNVTHMGAVDSAYKIGVIKLEEKKSFAIRRWKLKNIKVDLIEVVCGLDSSGSGKHLTELSCKLH